MENVTFWTMYNFTPIGCKSPKNKLQGEFWMLAKNKMSGLSKYHSASQDVDESRRSEPRKTLSAQEEAAIDINFEAEDYH